ncbi:MAG: phosphoenolpyruvate synthase [Bacteroidales bacterium]|nr:phosphoenolpyruvate synthase [Bacteroidales bacterium]
MPLLYKKFIESKKYYINETSFKLLMQKRIYKVLLICSNYDAFMIEEDGRIDEQIFNEYVSLNLRYPPIFIQANTAKKAFRLLGKGDIDLVITMLSVREIDAFALSNQIKEKFQNIPIVVLTPFSREVRMKITKENLSAIDYVFCWLGDADLLLAIIKLIEDKMNVEHDVKIVGVQTILLVEDSIRFYSSYLPNMYKIVLKQSQDFMKEGLNEHQRMLRKRGRPKILLATNYNEAIDLYEKYKHNLLGVISDTRYKKDGVEDAEAGIKLFKKIRSENKHLPFLLQSSETKNAKTAKKIGVSFINKNSKTLSIELRNYLFRRLAFGDFIFKTPDTKKEIARAKDLKELQKKILEIPDESLNYHIHRDDFSRWLNARALFSIAEIFKAHAPEDFESISEVRSYIYEEILKFRINKGRGIISKFDKNHFDEYLIFSRIGEGSLGGKGRGLAFIDSIIKKHQLFSDYKDVIITIPRTVVICTDIFDEFMESNNLYKVGLSKLDDEKILKRFVRAKLPKSLMEDLKTFIKYVDNPIAIRSSSLLEDSHYQPFAGVYSTYMIPNDKSDAKKMMTSLTTAIKSVYASVYFKNSKAYMEATSNLIDEEKMAIILQKVCGTKFGNKFYPTLSGVARSINFYPISPEKPEDGIANIAFGLGRTIVDGGVTLRFSPKYPKKILQLSTPQMTLSSTQKQFYALDLILDDYKASVNEDVNLLKLKIKDAENDNSLKDVTSTYDYENDIIRDGTGCEGKKIITFSNILRYNTFPLSEILDSLLNIGQKEMNNPIEIEFAVNLNTPSNAPRIFNFLQIRPIVDDKETININIDNISNEETIISSNSALGNGTINDIHDFIYVKPEAFKAAESKNIVLEIEKLNSQFVKNNKSYVLVGPGRWGSSDPWLGIPVKWSQISQARVIVEAGLENYRIDPSQGTHFFQNLTSFKVGYFTINPFINDGYYDLDFLNNENPNFENKFIRHIVFENEITIKIDGKHNKGIILKPKNTKKHVLKV